MRPNLPELTKVDWGVWKGFLFLTWMVMVLVLVRAIKLKTKIMAILMMNKGVVK